MGLFVECDRFGSMGVLVEGVCGPAPPTTAPAANVVTSGQIMLYDDTGGATPASLGIVPSNPSMPAICYPLSGNSETWTWNPILGQWI